MSALGATGFLPELGAVSDAVKSPGTGTKVNLAEIGAQPSIATGTVASEEKPQDSHIRGLVEQSVKNLNSELEQRHISLNFSIDDESESLVVQVVESKSGKIIRQIPPEDILALRKRLEELTGIMFDTEV